MTVLPNVLRSAARRGSSAAGVSCLLLTAAAGAQCPEWVELFPDYCAGPNGPVRAFATFDGDLIVGGQFSVAGAYPGSCGPPFVPTPTKGIARWDGLNWSAVGTGDGTGMNSSVLALTTFNDGGGEALYAGGLFTTAQGTAANYIAKWNGTSWSALGSGMNAGVYALTTFDDDGAGPHPTALYAGGYFTTAGGTSAKYIAKWNGTTWSSVGGGMNDYVRALATFNDGSGTKLYAGGAFTKANNKAADRIASWNGSAWSKLGSGVNGTSIVFALKAFNGGLFVGGQFAMAGGVAGTPGIARWSGSAWSKLGNGMNNTVMSLSTYDDGSGTALYAGGYFTAAIGGPPNTGHIARWNGTVWSALDLGMVVNPPGYTPVVQALATFDDGGGPALYPGGLFQVAPDGDVSIAKWQGCP